MTGSRKGNGVWLGGKAA